MKRARIYDELATYLRGLGYVDATGAGVKEWRERGLLPSARGLGRTRRPAGTRIPAGLRARVLEISRYHYDLRIRSLSVVAVLLWLDGYDLEGDVVREALASFQGLPASFVKRVGHPAVRAEPDADEADLEAAAAAATRSLTTQPWSEPTPRDALENAAVDFLRLATGRGQPEQVSDLDAFATAMGLDRAGKEGIPGAAPWLAGGSAASLVAALPALFDPGTARTVASASDANLERARDSTVRLARALAVGGAILRLGFAPGVAGLGLLAHAATGPEFRAWLAYVAVLLPAEASAMAAAFTPEQIEEWQNALAVGEAWLSAHPDVADDVAARGLVAVLETSAGAPL